VEYERRGCEHVPGLVNAPLFFELDSWPNTDLRFAPTRHEILAIRPPDGGDGGKGSERPHSLLRAACKHRATGSPPSHSVLLSPGLITPAFRAKDQRVKQWTRRCLASSLQFFTHRPISPSLHLPLLAVRLPLLRPRRRPLLRALLPALLLLVVLKSNHTIFVRPLRAAAYTRDPLASLQELQHRAVLAQQTDAVS
jgi:hypothetical protein